jgi:FKBP-type peptidyl-prolyl cis-trans isomerase
MTFVERLRPALGAGALVVALGGMTGCVEMPTGPTRFAPYSQADLRVGSGDAVETGDVVTVHYTGWFYDETRPDQKGAIFETSRAIAALQITVGSSGVIFGWNQGLPGMQVGGLRRLVIPPSSGYGGFRTGPVPPWTTMIFEIELISIDSE